jgi:regulator of replication initiation timing
MKIIITLLLLMTVVNLGLLMSCLGENETLRIENRTLKSHIYALEVLNSKLRFQNTMPQTDLKKGKVLPKDTLKFMKIALKSTHPDNGGNSEDFIRCNEIYKILVKNYKEQ